MKEIIIKFYNCEKHYTYETAKRFLISRFMKTDKMDFLEKLTELKKGQTTIILGGI